MGNGLTPGPAGDLGPPVRIDDGTLPRIESPPPGPIGLDAKSGSPKPSHATMADQIVAFPRPRMGQRYGNGECFDLADRALRSAGAKSASDFGTVVPDADYVWGTSINLSDLRPGDVIQLRDYRFDREVDTSNPDGSGTTATDMQERPHHTAIVERVGTNGEVTVLEQNSPQGAPITRNHLFFRSGTFTSGNQTTKITVQGSFWFYRPQTR
jgi:hypothetical protein